MTIGRSLLTFGRVAVTLLVLVVAALTAWRIWVYYIDEPWTDDAALDADVVKVAPDVSGLVSQIYVRDTQHVRKGDALFQIDQRRFILALAAAQASLAGSKATSEQATRDMRRALALNSLSVSRQQQQRATTASQTADANYQAAVASRNTADLNLERSLVRAPVNGVLTNFHVRPGDYVSAGVAVTALVDTDSFYVVGYFQETKLPRIEVGDRVTIHLMGQSGTIFGHVEGIAAGIASSQTTSSGNLLLNVNPTFTWVRLAQRVPVRIALDSTPAGIALVAGRTATVTVICSATASCGSPVPIASR